MTNKFVWSKLLLICGAAFFCLGGLPFLLAAVNPDWYGCASSNIGDIPVRDLLIRPICFVFLLSLFLPFGKGAQLVKSSSVLIIAFGLVTCLFIQCVVATQDQCLNAAAKGNPLSVVALFYFGSGMVGVVRYFRLKGFSCEEIQQ